MAEAVDGAVGIQTDVDEMEGISLNQHGEM